MRLKSNTATYASYLEDSLLNSNVVMAIHIEAPHASSAFRYAVLILQVFMLCVQFYGVVRHFLALRRAGWEQKGRGYDLSFGPAYTYTLAPPPVDSGLGVPLPWKDPDDAYVSGNTE